MGMLKVMDCNGHTEIGWDVMSPTETEEARRIFDRAMREGRAAYRVDDVRGNEVLRKFDPDAAEILLAVPLAGG